MKSVLIGTLLALVLVSAVSAQACDKTGDNKCPANVLITQSFTTPNCTGEYTLFALAGQNVSSTCYSFENALRANVDQSRTLTCSASAGQKTTTYSGSATCANNRLESIVTSVGSGFGKCIKISDTISSASYCSINDVVDTPPMAAPKAYKNTTEAFAELNGVEYTDCNTTAGCSTEGKYPTLFTYRDADNCDGEASSASVAGAVGWALLDTCYTTNSTGPVDTRSNFKLACSGGYLTVSTYSNAGGCTGAASTVQYPHNGCYQTAERAWAKVVCPSGGSNAPNAASSIYGSSLVAFFAIIAVFFL